MNFGLTEDQASIVGGLDQLLARATPPTPKTPVVAAYSAALDAAVSEAGFLDIARERGYGPLEAALVVERLARVPWAVEAGASALIAPALGLPAGTRPVA